jgi:hypothetical protein
MPLAHNSSILEAMRRPIKLVFHEHRITPIARPALIYRLTTKVATVR